MTPKEMFGKVRRMYKRDKKSLREIAKGTGLSRNTIRKWVTHHCHIVETGNESYRFAHSSMAAKSLIQAREQARKGGKTTKTATTPESF